LTQAIGPCQVWDNGCAKEQLNLDWGAGNLRILYITFGPTEFHLQARLSILSALNFCDARDVAVVTDNPNEFRDLAINVHEVTSAQIRRFRGPMNFVHRVKVEGMIHYHRQDPGPFVYVDSDTFWLKDPMELGVQLEKGCSLMERQEGVVSPRYFARLDRFLTQRAKSLEESGYGFTQRRRDMHIAGLVGLPGNGQRGELLDSVLRFTDYLTVRFPQQTEWVEQYAFSSILAEKQNLEAVEGFINHYWGCNCELQILLSRMNREEIARAAASPEVFDALLSRARELLDDSAYRKTLRRRKFRRSIQKRVGMFRALRCRLFPRAANV
jgi:hypothetical protein